MGSSAITMSHSGLWAGSTDIDTMAIDESAKEQCRELINDSIKKFNKFWNGKNINFKLNFLRNNIEEFYNLGTDEIDEDRILIVVDRCFINKSTELFGTFYLSIDYDTYYEYKLNEIFD